MRKLIPALLILAGLFFASAKAGEPIKAIGYDRTTGQFHFAALNASPAPAGPSNTQQIFNAVYLPATFTLAANPGSNPNPLGCITTPGFLTTDQILNCVYDPVHQALYVSSGGTALGTVTSIATTSPITGGTITTTGTLACPTCVVASSPGVGIAHFAGSTQTVTSSVVAASDFGTQSAQTVLAGPSAYAASAAAPTFRVLAPQDMPAGMMSCQILDNTICTSAVDALGHPNYISGSGGVVTVAGNVTPVTYFVSGQYQQINSALTVTCTTPGADTEFFIVAKLDTANANPVNADLVCTSSVPAYAYVAPSCPGSGMSSTTPSVFFNLANAGKSAWCTTNSGSYAAQGSIVLGEVVISSGPVTLAAVCEPFRLNPYKRVEMFGLGGAGSLAITSGSTTKNGAFYYSAVMVDTGTLTHTISASTAMRGLTVISQSPVILVNNGVIVSSSLGKAAAAAGTGAGTVGTNGGANAGGGGGGGGAGATNAGGVGGQYLYNISYTTVGGGGAAGTVGNAGSNGLNSTAVAAGAPDCNLQAYLGVGPSGANGGGDGVNNGGQGGTGGGEVRIDAPAILVSSGSSIAANGATGGAAAGGNAGGGGGGGGGTAIIRAGYITDGAGGTYTPTATGGTGGALAGTGKAGGNGGNGTAMACQLW